VATISISSARAKAAFLDEAKKGVHPRETLNTAPAAGGFTVESLSKEFLAVIASIASTVVPTLDNEEWNRHVKAELPRIERVFDRGKLQAREFAARDPIRPHRAWGAVEDR